MLLGKFYLEMGAANLIEIENNTNINIVKVIPRKLI